MRPQQRQKRLAKKLFRLILPAAGMMNVLEQHIHAEAQHELPALMRALLDLQLLPRPSLRVVLQQKKQAKTLLG
jgi:hypothetical protein